MRNRAIYSLIILMIPICLSTVHAQKIKAVRDPDSANILKMKKAGSDLPSGDLANAVEKDGSGKSTLKTSGDSRYQASVFCVPSRSTEVTNCVHRVFIGDLQTDENYEIVGEELYIEAGRMIDNLKWIDDHTLSYERWMSPHFGHRYIVDVKTMKQTAAFTLSDQ